MKDIFLLIHRDENVAYGIVAPLAGAYMLQVFSEAPGLPSQKYTKFRNEVIHKGKIPNREESMAYDEEVLNVIRPMLKSTRNSFHEGGQKTDIELSSEI